jgi:sensor histidine kinase YesM
MLPSAGLWAAGSPLLVWLARHRPVAPPHRVAALAIHIGAGWGWILSATVLGRAMDSVWRGWPPDGLLSSSTFTPSGILTDALIVSGLVVLGTHLAARDRAAEAELQRRDLAAENARLQELVTRAELLALRARLHPHFFFNALSAVGALVRKGDGQAAISMLAGIGDVLRAVLHADRSPLIPLERELDLVRRYIEVQHVRFDGLSWSIDMSPDVRSAPVPCLILQPIVENAVVHGVEASAGAGRVEIAATASGGYLEICVTNVGTALPDRFQIDRDAGNGLRLTFDRLRAIPGTPAPTLTSTERGVQACIRLPLERERSCAS